MEASGRSCCRWGGIGESDYRGMDGLVKREEVTSWAWFSGASVLDMTLKTYLAFC